MRMEAKHKQLKKWAQNSSYKNPCLTLATRHQQYAAYALSSHRFNSSEAVIYTGINNKSYSNIHYQEGCAYEKCVFIITRVYMLIKCVG